jgi:hypothetical protein
MSNKLTKPQQRALETIRARGVYDPRDRYAMPPEMRIGDATLDVLFRMGEIVPADTDDGYGCGWQVAPRGKPLVEVLAEPSEVLDRFNQSNPPVAEVHPDALKPAIADSYTARKLPTSPALMRALDTLRKYAPDPVPKPEPRERPQVEPLMVDHVQGTARPIMVHGANKVEVRHKAQQVAAQLSWNLGVIPFIDGTTHYRSAGASSADWIEVQSPNGAPLELAREQDMAREGRWSKPQQAAIEALPVDGVLVLDTTDNPQTLHRFRACPVCQEPLRPVVRRSMDQAVLYCGTTVHARCAE